MLTVPQTDVMALLRDFKCLRVSHIGKYLSGRHDSSPKHIRIMLKQLNVMGRIKLSDEFVSLPGRKTNGNTIKAFDVLTDLLESVSGTADAICPGTDPFTLTFSIKTSVQTNNCYGVVNAEPGFEDSICKRLQSISRELTVIFVLSHLEQQKLIRIDNRSYFAIQDENGRYQFYRAAEKPQY